MMLEEVRMLANKMDLQHKMLEEHKRLLERQAGEIADMKRLVTSGQASNAIQSQTNRELELNGADTLRLCSLEAEVVCTRNLDARSAERAALLEECRRVRSRSFKGHLPVCPSV